MLFYLISHETVKRIWIQADCLPERKTESKTVENQTMSNDQTMTLEQAQGRFQERYPEFRHKALHYFRDYTPEAKLEAVTNVMFLTWNYVSALVKRGKATDRLMLSTFCYGLKQTRAGRVTKTVKHSHSRELFDHEKRNGRAIVRGLHLAYFIASEQDVPTVVSFRVDTPAWLASLSDRDRKRALDLSTGAKACDLAKRWGCSQALVSDVRRQLAKSYAEFMHD
jgi:hypothetical protein